MRDDQQRRTLVTKRWKILLEKWRKSTVILRDHLKLDWKIVQTRREPVFLRLSLYNKFDKQFGGPNGDEQEIKEPYIEFNSSFKALERPARLVVFRFQKFI